jgi:hypothetical protein
MNSGYVLMVTAVSIAAAAEPCEISANAVMKYETRILSAIVSQPEKIDQPLKCLLEIQQKGEGETKYFAHKFLRPFFGGEMAKYQGLKKDFRYDLVTKRLEQNPAFAVEQFAKGDWDFYRLFCEKGDVSFCADFVPDEHNVKDDQPLLAAASILKLRQAYLVLKGEQRQVIAQRIRNLHKTIPAQDKIKRRFIDQVFQELFGPEIIPLGMA